MQGSNRKSPGKSQGNSSGTTGAENPGFTTIPDPQNQNGLASARILGLLGQIGERLVKSEEERIAMREALSDLENRSDMSERMFLTIEDRISKTDTQDNGLVQRQDNLERLYRESEERLQRAEALTEKIEEAIALQNRLARRLEKTAQDKARILSKIERIEEDVSKTREALGSQALIQLAEQVAANGWLPPTVANDRAQANAADIAWWKRPYKTQAGMMASLLAAGIIGGLAISQMVSHWPQVSSLTTSRMVTTDSSPLANGESSVLPDHMSAQTTTAPIPQSTAQQDIAPYSDNAIDAAMDKNADAVAADLNALTPGTAPADMPAAAPEKTASVTPPVAATPQNVANIGTDVISTAPVAKAPSAPIATPPAVMAPVAKIAPVQDGFDVDAFVRGQSGRTAPLATRISRDPALPPMVKAVEDKAFQAVPEAQHDLAAIYTAGHAGVTVDYKKAAAWFSEAAINGVANARYNLGVLYHQGLGVDKDVDKAISWYRAAAKLNHPEAEYNLGIAYIEGIGTKYDPRMATKYFEQAARGNVLEAAYNLGLIYENGLLGDVDMNEAVYWYKLASDSSPEARVALTQTMRKLNLTDNDVSRIVKEYSAVYKMPGSAAAKAPAIKTGAVDPLSEDPAVIAKSIPKLTKAESQSLLGSIHKDQAVIEQVQEQLIRMNLFKGQPDGVGGPDTEEAIRTYQKQSGLPVNGKPSEDLLIRMLANEIDTAASNETAQQGL